MVASFIACVDRGTWGTVEVLQRDLGGFQGQSSVDLVVFRLINGTELHGLTLRPRRDSTSLCASCCPSAFGRHCKHM